LTFFKLIVRFCHIDPLVICNASYYTAPTNWFTAMT
jgi:hypothetical protein